MITWVEGLEVIKEVILNAVSKVMRLSKVFYTVETASVKTPGRCLLSDIDNGRRGGTYRS